MKVFLGGTCGDSKWRASLIPKLRVEYFDPVVSDWNAEARARELRERETADFVLYAITPRMTGFYSIAEVVDDSNKRPDKTVLVILTGDDTAGPDEYVFSEAQTKSLKAVGELVTRNGGRVFYSLDDAADHVNSFARPAVTTAAAQCYDDAKEAAERREAEQRAAVRDYTGGPFV